MLARFCLARDAQPGQCGDSLARALRSEYPRKFVDADDPSSTLTIPRRSPAHPMSIGLAPPVDQLLCGEVESSGTSNALRDASLAVTSRQGGGLEESSR